jgi:hypothetical protein
MGTTDGIPGFLMVVLLIQFAHYPLDSKKLLDGAFPHKLHY